MGSLDLGELETCLRISIDSLLEGVQVIDRNWTYLYVNAAAARYGRRAVGDLLGRTMTECYPGIEGTELYGSMAEVMRTRQRLSVRQPFVYPEGDRRWFDLVIAPVPAGICVISLDVTDRQKLDAEVLREQEQNRFALSAARMSVWRFTVASSMISSDTLGSLLGLPDGDGPWTFDQVINWVVPADRPKVEAALQALKSGSTKEFSLQVALVPPDGRRRIFDAHCRVSADAEGRPVHVLGASIDVTERSEIERQLREAQKMEAMGRLAGGIAHDFNNQLTAILGFCDLAMADIDAASQVGQDLQEVRTAAERSVALTRQLLTFGRRDPVLAEALDLNEVVTELHRLLRRLLTVEISCQLELCEEPLFIMGDRSQLEHVLTNLVVNAGDAMPSGGRLSLRTLSSELTAAEAAGDPLLQPGRYAVLVVSDSGHGMDHATRARIFEPFFTTKAPGQGTGLGLSTVYGIVNQMNGFIRVESEVGAGTSVSVHLPLVRP